MQLDNTYPKIKSFICLFAMAILFLIGSPIYAQDTTKSILDINNSKIVKKANQLLDTTQKKINNFINKRIERVRDSLNKKTNKMLTTPARIGHNTGVIEVSKNKFMQYTIPMRLVILLHEFSHKYLNPKIDRPISYETGADIQGLYVYLGKGWSPYEAHKTYLQVFKNANNEPNHKRYKIINDFITKYEKGQISTQKK